MFVQRRYKSQTVTQLHRQKKKPREINALLSHLSKTHFHFVLLVQNKETKEKDRIKRHIFKAGSFKMAFCSHQLALRHTVRT